MGEGGETVQERDWVLRVYETAVQDWLSEGVVLRLPVDAVREGSVSDTEGDGGDNVQEKVKVCETLQEWVAVGEVVRRDREAVV